MSFKMSSTYFTTAEKKFLDLIAEQTEMLSSHQIHPFSLLPAYTLVTSPSSGQILDDLLLNYPYKAKFLLYLDLSTVQSKPEHCIFYILSPQLIPV